MYMCMYISCQTWLTAHSWWGEGLRVKPTAGVRSSCSSVTPGGGVNLKRWRREVKKRKSSILARPSPRHARRPWRQYRYNTFISVFIQFIWNRRCTWCESYQQKKAWMRLSSQISPACLGSVQGWMCWGFPIHCHHEGQMTVVGTPWSPGNTDSTQVMSHRCTSASGLRPVSPD